MGIEPLVVGTGRLRIFRHRLRPLLAEAGRWAPGAAADHAAPAAVAWVQAACAVAGAAVACGSAASSSRRPEADRGQPLQQAHAPLFRMLRPARRLAVLDAQLILCRQRQFVDPRHARPAIRSALRRGRDEGARRRRLEPLRLGAAGSGNSDGFGWNGRMVTSSTEVIGNTAAATAALAAFSIASWACAIARRGAPATADHCCASTRSAVRC